MMIAEAIRRLRPGASWTLNGEEYEGLTWLDTEQTQPSKEEVLAEEAIVQAEVNAQRYRMERRHQYPPMSDFADAMYWASKGDTTKLDAYYAACEAVKNAYPKP